MVFLQLFRTLEGKKVVVELRNDVVIEGTLQTADQFHNLRLIDVKVLHSADCPMLNCVSSLYIRGSTVRYISLQPADVDLDLLHDATRRHNEGAQ